MTPIIPLIPNVIPAKFGAMSTTAANGPVLTEPCIPTANVKNIMAAIELQPEYARAITNPPLTIVPFKKIKGHDKTNQIIKFLSYKKLFLVSSHLFWTFYLLSIDNLQKLRKSMRISFALNVGGHLKSHSENINFFE